MTASPESVRKQPRVNKGDVVELAIDALAYGGRGIARLDGYVIFVPHTVPGDRVRARLHKRKSSHGEAELVEVIEPSPARIAPPCPLFTTCGGCTWQHIAVETQEQWKQEIAAGTLRQVPGLDPATVIVDPIVASPEPFHYRNKMEFTFGRDGDGPLKIGFHEPDNWRNILDVRRCWLHPE
ncbi:class I SAM-dependent RNA methyltransferase, partial [Candidatus Poribacteria bacterium]|nr:class I SAM-dependent RNA methyltransferase [Candidatus Poribacteria bacterium]